MLNPRLPVQPLRRCFFTTAPRSHHPSPISSPHAELHARTLHSTRPTSTSLSPVTTATGTPFVPLAIPKPWETDLSPPATPVRVPFLPDNDLARYHRKEYVPSVAAPHKPIISTMAAESTFIGSPSAVTEVVDDSLPIGGESVGGAGVSVEGLKKMVRDTIEWRARVGEREGLGVMKEEASELTESKKDAIKAFAIGSAVWWVFGGGVMSVLGIL